MKRIRVLAGLWLGSMLTLSTSALGQVAIPAQNVPQDAALVKGKVDRFTLSAEGFPDGFILEDGTEVHVHVYLAKKLTAAVHRGEPVTVRGLRAPGTPFFTASSVTSELNHQIVQDTGNPEASVSGPAAAAPPAASPNEVTVEGTITRAIHRSDGAVTGAFLATGVEVRMPDGVAADWPNLFKVGQNLAATGQDVETEFGRVIRIATLGPSTNQLSPVTPGYQPPPRP